MALAGVDNYRIGWIAVGVLLAVILGFVTYAFLGTVVFGIFLYYATRPLHERIRPRIGQPTLAAIISLFLLVVPLIILLVYAGAIALQEFSAIASEIELGPYQDLLEPYLDVSSVIDDPASLLENIGDPGQILGVATAALGYVGVVGIGLLYLFTSITIAFYLLRDTRRLAGYAALLDDDQGVLQEYGRAVDRSLKKIYFGNILNAFLTGIFAAIAYSIVNLAAPDAFAVPYPALVGILTGAGSLIPVVGIQIVYVPLLVYLVAMAVVTGTGWVFVAIVAFVSVVVVGFIPDMLLRPYVSGGDLHTGTVIFAYIVGPIIWGWYGLFLGPLLLVLGTHFARIVLPELLAGEPIRPTALDPAVLASGESHDGDEMLYEGTKRSETHDSTDARVSGGTGDKTDNEPTAGTDGGTGASEGSEPADSDGSTE